MAAKPSYGAMNFSASKDEPTFTKGSRSVGSVVRAALLLAVVSAAAIGMTMHFPMGSRGTSKLASADASSTEATLTPSTEAAATAVAEDSVALKTQMATKSVPSDSEATTLTKALYSTLYYLTFNSSGFVFGHEADNFIGQAFKDVKGYQMRSDIYEATGTYPLMSGVNVQTILDNIKKGEEDFSTHIKTTYLMGGYTQLMWDVDNPINFGGTHNCSGNPISELMPGGTANKRWLEWLDQLADYLKGLTDGTGNTIPVVLRLFHEVTGTWYWWSTRCATASEYKKAWRYTVHYLRDTKAVHNVIYIYCPSNPSEYSEEAFEEYWPGDTYVDMVGFDKYSKALEYSTDVASDCKTVQKVARSLDVPFAIGETGVSQGLTNGYVGEDFFNIMKATITGHCELASYVLTWSNYSPDKYWTPLEGQKTYDGFVAMMDGDDVFSRSGESDYYTFARGTGYATRNMLEIEYYPGYWDEEGNQPPNWIV